MEDKRSREILEFKKFLRESREKPDLGADASQFHGDHRCRRRIARDAGFPGIPNTAGELSLAGREGGAYPANADAEVNGMRENVMTREMCEEKIQWLGLGAYDDNTGAYRPYSAEERAEVDAEVQQLLTQLAGAPDANAFEPLEAIARCRGRWTVFSARLKGSNGPSRSPNAR